MKFFFELLFCAETAHSRLRGRKPTEVWIEWVQEQPALVSGASNIPPAEIRLNQHPLRIPSNWLRLLVLKSHMP